MYVTTNNQELRIALSWCIFICIHTNMQHAYACVHTQVFEQVHLIHMRTCLHIKATTKVFSTSYLEFLEVQLTPLSNGLSTVHMNSITRVNIT